MSGILGGGDNGAVDLQRKIAAQNQRKQLAALAKAAAETDQATAKAKGGGRRAGGNKLLTYIGSSSGQSTLG
ncbi:hypothetical protein SAMN04488056_12328 [Cohaesibacter marisflavi]|uniref:Uncharacterized protein n=1 Tax=Cohaesibacter marisflavi TaxID=655353 RepID=A0A1I5MTU6_9HYPH|nr:hypothetical protein [Cohaesibacter marisflavi]SFP12992.1 hypothetical protein SAMN04488056_12328 [Cohaesibacter marisflavi]